MKKDIDLLPDPIALHVFNYFSPPELHLIKLVCKNFNRLSKKVLEDLISRTKDQIYYTTGLPITIAIPHYSSSVNRDQIPCIEIYNSFMKAGSFELFESEEMALSNWLFLNNGFHNIPGEKKERAAVFKVQYLGNIAEIEKKKTNINNGQSKTLEYFSSTKSQLLPLTGIITRNESNNNNVKILGEINFNDKLSEQLSTKEKNEKSLCKVM